MASSEPSIMAEAEAAVAGVAIGDFAGLLGSKLAKDASLANFVSALVDKHRYLFVEY